MKYLLLSITVIIFFSCKVGPNSPVLSDRDTHPQLDTFRFDSIKTDTMVNLRWWELFQDKELDSLIHIGLEENRNVLIAISRIRQAQAELGFSKADLYPKIGVNAEVGRRNSFGSLQIPTQNNYYAVGTLNWELDLWGKIRRANESARAQILANEYSLRQIQIELISDIISTYFLYLDYRSRLEISRQTLALRDSSEKIIQAKYDYGTVPMLDLNQAQIQTAIAEGAIPRYERLVANASNAISILIGHSPDSLLVTKTIEEQPTPPYIPVGLPSSILARRPDVQQQVQLVYAQNAQIGVAVAQRFPSISLTGTLGLASTELSTLLDNGASWSITGGLLAPIFNFGKNKRRVDIEREKTEQAIYQYEQKVLEAFQEVEDALIAVRTQQQEFKAKEKHVAAAINARSLAELRYSKGVSSYLEVIEYQRSAFEAELQLVEIRKNMLNSYVFLYKALGGGWLTIEEEQEAEQQQNGN